MTEGKKVAEEHAEWFRGWAERLAMPEDHNELAEIVLHAYRDAMEHGYKHGYDARMDEEE